MEGNHTTNGDRYPVVELYHEFLTCMEQTDYSDNQIVLNNSELSLNYGGDNLLTNTNDASVDSKVLKATSKPKSKHNQCDPDTHKYSPTFTRRPSPGSLSSQIKPISKHAESELPVSPTSSDSLKSHEFVNANDFKLPLAFDPQIDYDYTLNLEHNISLLSSDEEEEDERLQYQFLQNATKCSTDEMNDPQSSNPLVPGLFPKMNLNDDETFLKFDKLPLNPSYIVNSDDSS